MYYFNGEVIITAPPGRLIVWKTLVQPAECSDRDRCHLTDAQGYQELPGVLDQALMAVFASMTY